MVIYACKIQAELIRISLNQIKASNYFRQIIFGRISIFYTINYVMRTQPEAFSENFLIKVRRMIGFYFIYFRKSRYAIFMRC